MSSSRNRFTPLGEPSSSKEQETVVPTPDITDQKMLDTARIDPSTGKEPTSIGGLNASSPKELEEKDRRDKMQQSDFSAFVGKPTFPATSSKGLRKRRASSDEAEDPSKRQRLEALSPDTAAEELVTAACPTPPEATSSASAIVSQDPFLSPPASFNWSSLRMPKEPLLCIVQANDSALIGCLAEDTDKWAFQLIFSAGRRQVPNMTMKFFSDGIKGPQIAQTGWSLGEWMKDDWMVTDLKVHRVADCAENGRIRHRDILSACRSDEEKARLICISLEAWPKILGHFDASNRWKNPQPGAKKLFSAVLTGRHLYHLRIWFIAPGELKAFEEQCLSIFTLFFHKRRPCYNGFCDSNGVGFLLPQYDGLPASKLKPVPSETQSQHNLRRAASLFEAGKSSEGQPTEPVEGPANAASASAALESPSASTPAVQEEPDSSPWWVGFGIPKKPIPCIIQVGMLARMGRFPGEKYKWDSHRSHDWSFQLRFDAGLQKSPSMVMEFVFKGETKLPEAKTEWRLADSVRDEWTVTDFETHRIVDSFHKRRIFHRRITDACQTDEEFDRCVCISMVASPLSVVHSNDKAAEHTQFSAIFKGDQSYQLKIWFIAPDDVEGFEKSCLSYFTRLFQQRKSAHYGITKA